MAQLSLFYFGLFKDLTHREHEVYQGDEESLVGLLDRLAAKYGADFRQAVLDTEKGTLISHSTVLVNGQQRPLEWGLADGDEVVFLTAFAGGSGCHPGV